MKHLYLQLTALSPLAIRSDHAEGGVDTAQYIPGATLLGSLAAAHRILYPDNEDTFASLFLHEQVYFPHLYPAQFSVGNFQVNIPVMPLPKTAQTCKRFSGFRPVPGEEVDTDRHGIRDSLLDWTIFSLLNSEGAAIPISLSPFNDHDTCSYNKSANDRCPQVMDHADGYYRRSGELRMQPKTSTRLQTRTGINREWGIVEESILYNRQVFDEDMRFWGEVILSEELADSFKTFVSEASKENVVRIGTGRTRGLGHVQIVIRNAPRRKSDDFITKLQKFNEVLQQRADGKVQQLKPFYFAITLQSPTILCDSFFRYQKTLEPKVLPELLGLTQSTTPTYTFHSVYHSTRTQRITGWNELWGTPRPNDYAIEMGSTFVFACEQPLDNNLIQALQQLEETGIGRRRSDGFGRVPISDPFHLEEKQA